VLVSHSSAAVHLGVPRLGDGSKFGLGLVYWLNWSMQRRPVIEVFPFEDAPKAHKRILSGDAHLRVVFDIATSGRRTRNPIARHKLGLWTTTQHQEWLENHAAAPLRRVTPQFSGREPPSRS
jgi:hypothetical protein